MSRIKRNSLRYIIIKEKEDLEKEILNFVSPLIEKFEFNTGLKIRNITINFQEIFTVNGDKRYAISGVDIDVDV